MTWLDWLIAPVCPLCDRPTASGIGCFCRDCAAQLQPIRSGEWIRDVIVSDPNESGSKMPNSQPFRPLQIYSWGPYDGILNRTLRSLKYDGHPEIADTVGRWMGERWRLAIAEARSRASQSPATVSSRSAKTVASPKKDRPKVYTVVPIPLHRDRRQERGFNQAEILARAFCEETGDRLASTILGRVRATVPQFGLSAAERADNVGQAFAAPPASQYRFGDRPIVLFDDIFTTGSTLVAARSVLERQGWHVVAAVVVARAGIDSA